jgi:ribosomal protein L37E
VGKRGVRVLELEDFLCRCGAADFRREAEQEPEPEAPEPRSMTCRRCGRRYEVRRLEKKSRLSGLPMSLGFRSLYWDRFDHSGGSQYGVAEEGWEIREAEGPGRIV